jgi:hypothetical protein
MAATGSGRQPGHERSRPARAHQSAVVRKFNPRATILALQPFGIANGSLAVYPNEIRAAIEAHRQAGDSRVMYVDTAGWLGAGDFTDGVHPNPNGNRKAAEKLGEIILNLSAAANPNAVVGPPILIPVDRKTVACPA